MSKNIYAEGVWCPDCEFFEEPDFVQGQCLACGCGEGTHVEVEVVDK